MPPKSTTTRLQFVRVCDCGCGRPTLLALQTNTARGWKAGQPLGCCTGHSVHRPAAAEEYQVNEHGCWMWQQGITTPGYARMTVDGKEALAHRVFYERRFGPIPAGLHLDHVKSRGCVGPPCVNPDHMEPVTPGENARRGNGTKLSLDDVAAIRSQNPRTLAECKRLAAEYGVAWRYLYMIVKGWSRRDSGSSAVYPATPPPSA